MIDMKTRTFLTVIDEGTLQKASEKLCLTQPAVSQQLKALEAEYGVPLFNRAGRHLVLSDAGRILEQAARQAEGLGRLTQRDLASLKDGKRSYRLGATLTIGEFILPPLLAEYGMNNPHLELSLMIENTITILAQLDRGELDLALVEGPFDKELYGSQLFLEDEMILIGPAPEIPDEDQPMTPEELRNRRLILREEGSGTRYRWEQYKTGMGMDLPPPVLEVGSLSAIKSLVESGFGWSVMSSRAVEKERRLGTLKSRPFSMGPLIREMRFVYRYKSLSPFREDFIGFVSGSL